MEDGLEATGMSPSKVHQLILLGLLLLWVLGDTSPVNSRRGGSKKSSHLRKAWLHHQNKRLQTRSERLKMKRRSVNEHPLDTLANMTICPYKVVRNRQQDPNMFPEIIEEVECISDEVGCSCKKEGSYKCIQLTTQLKMFNKATKEFSSKKIKYGCVCGKEPTGTLAVESPTSEVE